MQRKLALYPKRLACTKAAIVGPRCEQSNLMAAAWLHGKLKISSLQPCQKPNIFFDS